MNNEIKEYLDKCNYKFKDVDENGNEVEMTLSEMIQNLLDTNERLYNCITNLQEENDRLKERISYLERSNNRREDTIVGLREEIVEYEDYKSRIDKAIEYIGNGNLGIPRKVRDKFIKILQGSDKE